VRRPWDTFWYLLRDPDSFFEELHDQSGLRTEAILLTLVGAIGFAAMVFFMNEVLTTFPVQAKRGRAVDTEKALTEPVRRTLQYEMTLRPLVGIFLLWGGFAVLFWAISWLFGGRGSINQTLKSVAWGLVPVGVGNAIYYGAFSVAIYLASFNPAERPNQTGLESGSQNIPADMTLMWLANHAQTKLYVLVAAVIAIALVGVSGYLCSYAVKHARDLSLEDARKTVVLPVVAYMGYLVHDILTYTIWAHELAKVNL